MPTSHDSRRSALPSPKATLSKFSLKVSRGVAMVSTRTKTSRRAKIPRSLRSYQNVLPKYRFLARLDFTNSTQSIPKISTIWLLKHSQVCSHLNCSPRAQIQITKVASNPTLHLPFHSPSPKFTGLLHNRDNLLPQRDHRDKARIDPKRYSF